MAVWLLLLNDNSNSTDSPLSFNRYLNTQHIKKQKATDAELLYGTLTYESPEQMKEIGELGNDALNSAATRNHS